MSKKMFTAALIALACSFAVSCKDAVSDSGSTLPEITGKYTLYLEDSVNGAVEVSPESGNRMYRPGTQLVLSATPADGYVFSSWIGDSVGGTSPLVLELDSDKYIGAIFRPVTSTAYTLTVTEPDFGRIELSPHKAEYLDGEIVTVTAIADPDYILDSWIGDLSGRYTSMNITMNSNKTVSAVFSEALYINAEENPSGNIYMYPQGPYVLNDSVTIYASPNYGYAFSEWTGDISGTSDPLNITITDDMTIGAVFNETPRYTVTSTSGSGGSISLTNTVTMAAVRSGDSIPEGTVIQADAVPETYYALSAFSGCVSSMDSTVYFTVNSDCSIHADFVYIGPPDVYDSTEILSVTPISKVLDYGLTVVAAAIEYRDIVDFGSLSNTGYSFTYHFWDSAWTYITPTNLRVYTAASPELLPTGSYAEGRYVIVEFDPSAYSDISYYNGALSNTKGYPLVGSAQTSDITYTSGQKILSTGTVFSSDASSYVRELVREEFDDDLFTSSVTVESSNQLYYSLRVPSGSGPFPLLVSISGDILSSESYPRRNVDSSKIATEWISSNGFDDMIILAPQPGNITLNRSALAANWKGDAPLYAEQILELIDYVKANYSVDSAGVYVMGYDLGASTGIAMALSSPGDVTALYSIGANDAYTNDLIASGISTVLQPISDYKTGVCFAELGSAFNSFSEQAHMAITSNYTAASADPALYLRYDAFMGDPTLYIEALNSTESAEWIFSYTR